MPNYILSSGQRSAYRSINIQGLDGISIKYLAKMFPEAKEEKERIQLSLEQKTQQDKVSSISIVIILDTENSLTLILGFIMIVEEYRCLLKSTT